MRYILIRFAVPAFIAVSILAFLGVPYVDRILADWFRSDVDLRAQLVAHSMEGAIAERLERGDRKGAANSPKGCMPLARHTRSCACRTIRRAPSRNL